MAYDEATAARVRKILARRSGVSERKMMGTLSFVLEGATFCAVSGSSLLVRVTQDERERTLREPHVGPMTMGARIMKAFVLVAPEGIAEDAALKRWLERARKGR